MAQTKHVLKFSAIANFFCEAGERKLISRGENAVESNHIKSFQFLADVLVIKAEVHASMRDRIYKVEVNLDQEGEILSCSCTCPRGQFLCHHVAATCIYGHHNISVTDVECRWAARKTKNEEVQTIDEIFLGKSHKSMKEKLTSAEVEDFRGKLQNFGTPIGFSWLLRPEPSSGTNLVRDVEDFLFSEDYFNSEDKTKCFLNTMEISDEIIHLVCQSSIGQSENENWLTYRKNRLTASNFGVVLAAIKRNKYPPSLFKRLLGSYNLQNVKAVQWGKENENLAKKEFSAVTNMQVTDTGLWLDKCGFLGASPDGLVGDNAIIEIKCPYKFREKRLSVELSKDKSYVIYFDNETLHVNKEHEYYQQIQGNLNLTGRDICYLYIWTPVDSILFEIVKDKNWYVNINILKQFYIEKYLPCIV